MSIKEPHSQREVAGQLWESMTAICYTGLGWSSRILSCLLPLYCFDGIDYWVDPACEEEAA